MPVQERTARAIFFDFDGVLVESIAIKRDGFATLYGEYGADVVDYVLDYNQRNEGISRLVKIRHCHLKCLGIDLSDAKLGVLGRRFSALVETAVVACDWVVGAKEFLERHAATLPLFVISGTPDDELSRVIVARDMERYFTSVHGSPRSKAEIGAQLLERHGLNPADVLFVGDAMADFNAAHSLAIPFVGRVGVQGYPADGINNADPADGINKFSHPFPDGTALISDMSELRLRPAD